MGQTTRSIRREGGTQRAEITAQRTSFDKVLRLFLETLTKHTSEPMTIQDVVRETKLNRKTVEKAVPLLEAMNEYFALNELKKFHKGSRTLLELEPRQVGLLSLPEDIQSMIIRTRYFPQPSREQELLTFLYLKGALNPDSAVTLKAGEIVNQLLEAENIAKAPPLRPGRSPSYSTGGPPILGVYEGRGVPPSASEEEARFYLTDIGKTVAEGTLEIFPELKNA